MERWPKWLWRLLDRASTRRDVRFAALAAKAGQREKALEALSDGQLTAAITGLREAFDPVTYVAHAREAVRRSHDVRPFDTQLQGALRMLDGEVVEMATGEGKTLVGAITAVGYVLRGRSVHVMTVNDYLARRDAEWMAPFYEIAGVTVGWFGSESTVAERRVAYAADVTYGPVTEFGFDLLRDRLAEDVADQVAPEADVVLIDEIDSALVDQARVPMVLAGQTEGLDVLVAAVEAVAELLPGRHFEVDVETRSVHLTTSGEAVVSAALGDVDLYAADDEGSLLARVNVALHARALVHRDVDYIVVDGRIKLVDASRGRVAALQRWPDGLHAAVEAKEGLAPTARGEILDMLTVQGLAGRYRTLSGMSGTASKAQEQLRTFHEVEVGIIPPHRPLRRTDEPDRVHVDTATRDAAVVAEVAAVHETGQPVLVATLDVAESERLAARLRAAGIETTLLNAKNDSDEAAVIAEAGARDTVTISTQMSGRGTDILLGSDEVRELGGLRVILVGHQPSARHDDQLRGRAGRQGDPGSSVVFASLEDAQVLRVTGDADPITEEPDAEGRLTGRAAADFVAFAQRAEEGTDLEVHRTTWRYTRLLEQQRAVLGRRRDVLLRGGAALELLGARVPERRAELAAELDDPEGDDAELRRAARLVLVHEVDRGWADHLSAMAELREAIHLRIISRVDPLDEFHRESIAAFESLEPEAVERAVAVFEKLTVVDGAVDVASAGVARPSSTWTYVVTDDPFGSEFERFSGSVFRKALRGT